MIPGESELTANFVDAIRAVAESTGGEVQDISGVICIKSPLKPVLFNTAFLNAHTPLSDDLLDNIKAFYRDKAKWGFIVSPGAESLLEAVIEHVKVSERSGLPEMVVGIGNAKFGEQPADLEIEVVSESDRFAVWVSVLEKGFGLEPGSFGPLVTKKALEVPGMTYFLGLSNGNPVSTSMALISGRIVGIYSVSTVPEARGRGFGEALTAAASKHGFANGCTISSLQASGKGFPVYFRMGYRRIYDYESWIVKN